jgi:hypothetical protein
MHRPADPFCVFYFRQAASSWQPPHPTPRVPAYCLQVHADPHIPYVPGWLVDFVLKIVAPFVYAQLCKASALLTGCQGRVLPRGRCGRHNARPRGGSGSLAAGRQQRLSHALGACATCPQTRPLNPPAGAGHELRRPWGRLPAAYCCRS